MVDMFLFWCLLTILHLNIDEWNNLGLQSIFGSFNDNDEFLALLWSNFQWDLFLELFGYRIFNKPAIELNFRILYASSILVLKGEFISIVLAEDIVTVVFFFCFEIDNLIN